MFSRPAISESSESQWLASLLDLNKVAIGPTDCLKNKNALYSAGSLIIDLLAGLALLRSLNYAVLDLNP
jgi:hypothetical protein